MKRVSHKMLTTFITEVADIKPSNIPGNDVMCYYSKLDGSYFTHVGLESDLKFLLKKGIIKELQSASGSGRTVSLGFNPEENKWYGWSHRAIYGFTIGSTCKPGDCHYRPSNRRNFIKDCKRFWDDENHKVTISKEWRNDEGELGVRTYWVYADTIPNKMLRGSSNSIFDAYPDEFGKGKWTAKTMEDAKQMAVDFANGVS